MNSRPPDFPGDFYRAQVRAFGRAESYPMSPVLYQAEPPRLYYLPSRWLAPSACASDAEHPDIIILGGSERTGIIFPFMSVVRQKNNLKSGLERTETTFKNMKKQDKINTSRDICLFNERQSDFIVRHRASVFRSAAPWVRWK